MNRDALVLVAAWLCAGAAPASTQGGANRLGRASVELTGPLTEVVLDLGGEGRTVIEVELVAGERREWTVPLPTWTEVRADDPPPVVRTAGGGAARFLGWWTSEPDASAAAGGRVDEAARKFAALPEALRNRPRPAVVRRSPAADGASLALLAVAFVLTAGLRRRPWAALGVGALIGAFLYEGPLGSEPARGVVSVLEGDARSGLWLEVRSSRGALEVDPRRVGWVESVPERAPLVWRVRPAGDGERWSVGSAGTLGVRLHALEARPELGLLLPALNDLADLAAAWHRGGGGAGWSALGAWPRGAELPLARPDPSAAEEAPPGWLASGLPQGLGVLLARVTPAPGSEAGAEDGAAGRSASTWIRLVGF